MHEYFFLKVSVKNIAADVDYIFIYVFIIFFNVSYLNRVFQNNKFYEILKYYVNAIT